MDPFFTCPHHFFLTQYAAMNDNLIKGHVKGLDVAFSCAQTTNTVHEIIIGHDCDPVAAHLLGRALTGALLSAAVLPTEQRINVCWKYKGALRTIVVDAGQDGTVYKGDSFPLRCPAWQNCRLNHGQDWRSEYSLMDALTHQDHNTVTDPDYIPEFPRKFA